MFKNNLKAVRKAKGKTQKEIADIIGISQNAYSYWESGKVKLNSDSIAVLAEYYGISIDFLLGRRYKMRRPPSEWESDFQEDYKKADDNLKKYMEGKFGDIIFVDSEYIAGNTEKPTAYSDELSESRKALIDFAMTVPEEKAEMILRVMKSILAES